MRCPKTGPGHPQLLRVFMFNHNLWRLFFKRRKEEIPIKNKHNVINVIGDELLIFRFGDDGINSYYNSVPAQLHAAGIYMGT